MTEEKLIRVNILFKQETIDFLDRFSVAVGLSRSALVRGLIEEAQPNLDKVLSNIESIKTSEPETILERLDRMSKIYNKLSDNVQKGLDLI